MSFLREIGPSHMVITISGCFHRFCVETQGAFIEAMTANTPVVAMQSVFRNGCAGRKYWFTCR